jgi:DNA processing protein
MSDIRYWIALNMISDIGLVRTRALLSEFGDAENIFSASTEDLMRVPGIGAKMAGNIASFCQWKRVDAEILRAERLGVRILPIGHPDYPESLKAIQSAPIVLYVRGSLTAEDSFAVAMVGSRKPTEYGRRTALRMSRDLASAGLTIVSGMALGIDTAAHRGALDAGGRTVAVLGSGVDVPYPVSNRNLMERITSSGAVISEFPMGMIPARENFPRRNRIISALSSGVIVVEASLDSGSLITVRYALEQGKDVFAVPGNVTSDTSRGTNRLIKDGAILVEDAREVLAELAPQLKTMIRDRRAVSPDLTDEERSVFSLLGSEPVHIDVLSRQTAMPSGKALSVLLSLELKGIVKQTEGKCFYLA